MRTVILKVTETLGLRYPVLNIVQMTGGSAQVGLLRWVCSGGSAQVGLLRWVRSGGSAQVGLLRWVC